jgi:hypothetical protein
MAAGVVPPVARTPTHAAKELFALGSAHDNRLCCGTYPEPQFFLVSAPARRYIR